MGLRQRSEQVGQDNGKEQSRKEMRSLWVQLPLYLRRLSVSVLLIAILIGVLLINRSVYALITEP
jgi:hypothetical protein